MTPLHQLQQLTCLEAHPPAHLRLGMLPESEAPAAQLRPSEAALVTPALLNPAAVAPPSAGSPATPPPAAQPNAPAAQPVQIHIVNLSVPWTAAGPHMLALTC